MAATNSALHTAEILERILLLLPPLDVLLNSRVSRFWQATIKGSIQIQRGLFLTSLGGNLERAGTFVANPYLGFGFRRTDFQHMAKWALTRVCFLSGRHGSWENMLVTQPPCASLITRCECCTEMGGITHTGGRKVLRNATGVTMGEFVGAINAHVALCGPGEMQHSAWVIEFAQGDKVGFLQKQDGFFADALLRTPDGERRRKP